MLTLQLVAEGTLLFILAIGLIFKGVSAIKKIIFLYQREGIANDRRLYFGVRRPNLLIWSFCRVLDLLLFSICVNFWLQRYQEAQTTRPVDAGVLKDDPLTATIWIRNGQVVFL